MENSGVVYMLKHEKIDDLRVMYNILQRVKTDGIEAMKNVSILKDSELQKFNLTLIIGCLKISA